jgi:magnesium transporter
MVRIESSIENPREWTDTILTTHMSAIANQQNETMKTLSLIAAIFLPLTLLAWHLRHELRVHAGVGVPV